MMVGGSIWFGITFRDLFKFLLTEYDQESGMKMTCKSFIIILTYMLGLLEL
jgi:hypothetical protein